MVAFRDVLSDKWDRNVMIGAKRQMNPNSFSSVFLVRIVIVPRLLRDHHTSSFEARQCRLLLADKVKLRVHFPVHLSTSF